MSLIGMLASGTAGGYPSSPEKCFLQFSTRSAELPPSTSPQPDLVLPVISLTRFQLSLFLHRSAVSSTFLIFPSGSPPPLHCSRPSAGPFSWRLLLYFPRKCIGGTCPSPRTILFLLSQLEGHLMDRSVFVEPSWVEDSCLQLQSQPQASHTSQWLSPPPLLDTKTYSAHQQHTAFGVPHPF